MIHHRASCIYHMLLVNRHGEINKVVNPSFLGLNAGGRLSFIIGFTILGGPPVAKKENMSFPTLEVKVDPQHCKCNRRALSSDIAYNV